MSFTRPYPKPERKPKTTKVYKAKPRKDLSEYQKVRATYLKEHPLCECGCGERATEVHHKKGRIGKLLTDTEFFMAVASFCHAEIHNNPKWAFEQGYMLTRCA